MKPYLIGERDGERGHPVAIVRTETLAKSLIPEMINQQVSQSIRRACVVVVAVGITFVVSSESPIDKRQNTTLAALTLRRSIN